MKRLFGVIWATLLLSLATTGCTPKSDARPIEPSRFILWHAQDGARLWTSRGLTAGLAVMLTKNGPSPTWTISAPGVRPARVNFIDGTTMDGVNIGIGPLTRGGPPSVIVQVFSGGTHCCWRVYVATPVDGAFRITYVEEWDGDAIAWPKDLDGDGTVDFQNIDARFQFAFGIYMCCTSPPVIFDIRDGKSVDVSKEPGFAPVFRADMAHYARCPTEGGQSACAAYAADAARLGELDRVWPQIFAHFTRKDEFVDWNQSQWSCYGKLTPYCRPTYTETLKAFLRQNGYIG
jgi:hypothetical protein